MTKDKQHQTKLVTSEGKTRPAFPVGWVYAIFDAVHILIPERIKADALPYSTRSLVRVKKGAPVWQADFDEVKAKLASFLTLLFPAVAKTKGFITKYADEYFECWENAVQCAPFF